MIFLTFTVESNTIGIIVDNPNFITVYLIRCSSSILVNKYGSTVKFIRSKNLKE